MHAHTENSSQYIIRSNAASFPSPPPPPFHVLGDCSSVHQYPGSFLFFSFYRTSLELALHCIVSTDDYCSIITLKQCYNSQAKIERKKSFATQK